jgi:PAS domain S-box-containing protein
VSINRIGGSGDEKKNKRQLIDELKDLRSQVAVLKDSEAKCKLTEKALSESEEKFKRIVQTAEEGIWVIDSEDRTTLVNFRMADMLGYTAGEMIGKFPYEFMDEEHAEIVVTNLRRRRFGVKESFTHKLRRKDKSSIWVFMSSTPLFNDGEYDGTLTMVTDISSLKKVEDDLRESMIQAELYVDLMGHDINNMNQITMGFLELTGEIIENEGKLDKDNTYLLEKAIESLNNCSRLIDNVRKLQREKRGLYIQEIMDIGKILKDVVLQFQYIPGREVKVIYDDSDGYLVKANELLRDVFINIVNNAIKHSSGPLTVSIKVDKIVRADGTFYKVGIEDNGPGIPDTLKRTLFDRLNLSNTKASGKGFGLCLIKMLVDDYEGSFRVEDRVAGDYKQGSRFVVMLPASINAE